MTHTEQMMNHVDGAISMIDRKPKRVPIMEIETELCDQPCVVKVYVAKRGYTPPGYISTFNDPRVIDAEVEYEVHDVSGNRLDWIERHVGDDDVIELIEQTGE